MPNKVIIYTGEGCPHCMAAKAFFKEKGIPFEEKDTANEEYAKEAQEKSGMTAVPIIDIDGKIVVGFDQEKIEELIK